MIGVTEAGDVNVRVTRGIATIQFGHPKGNSLPGALLQRITAAIDDTGRDATARVVILRSQDPGPFCAGASFDELRGIADVDVGTRSSSSRACTERRSVVALASRQPPTMPSPARRRRFA